MSVNSAQSAVTSVQRDIESLNQKLVGLAKDEASKTNRIASISKSISKSTSASSYESKQREIQGLQADIGRIQGKKADVTRNIAGKTEKLHKAQRELFDAQQKEQKRAIESLAQIGQEQSRRILDQLHAPVPEINPQVAAATTLHDAFISHASEDKDELVRPLAELLESMGHSIWYDEFRLTVGASLRRSIDKGLASSRFGIVVLSPSFFAKQWPQYELDGLVAKEIVGGRVILPLWHRVSKDDVIGYSPSLADRVALNTATFTIVELAEALSKALS